MGLILIYVWGAFHLKFLVGGTLHSCAGAMFPGLRAEISEVLANDYANLQVLHEALDQPGGLVALADDISARLGDEQFMVARELRQFKEHSGRDMEREKRLLHRRLVRPRLEEPTVHAGDLQETFAGLLRKESIPVRQTRKTRLSQNLILEVGNPLQVAEEERLRWASVLAQYLEAAALPVVAMVRESEDPQKTWGRIFGSRRAKTLRNRATTWKRYYIWLVLNRTRHWPTRIGDVLDYLEGRIQDGCGPTAPQGLMGALALLETVGRVEDSKKLSRDRTLLDSIRNMQMELQVDAPPRRPAKPHLIGTMIGLELLIVSEEYNNYSRLIAWVMLLMCWMVMRADDVQWIDPSRMYMDGTSARLILRRTKTTGPGRRAVEVPAYVTRNASLSGEDWLGAGWDLYHSAEFQGDRDYFLPGPNKDWSGGAKKYLNVENLNSIMRHVLSLIKKPLRGGRNPRTWMESGEPFISGEITNFWSGHSGRHWLPTHAANIGIPKEQRDYLGRWQAGAQESNAYIMSSKQIVTSIQRDVNRAICEGNVGLTEGELIQELKEYAEARGVFQRDGRWFHVMLRYQDHRCGLRTGYPALQLGTDDDEIEETVAGWGQAVPLEEKGPASGSKDKVKECPYWISISRRTGFRRLHKKSSACGVQYWTVASYEEVERMPKDGVDAWCKLCFKAELDAQEQEDSSSSGSSTSTAEEAPSE